MHQFSFFSLTLLHSPSLLFNLHLPQFIYHHHSHQITEKHSSISLHSSPSLNLRSYLSTSISINSLHLLHFPSSSSSVLQHHQPSPFCFILHHRHAFIEPASAITTSLQSSPSLLRINNATTTSATISCTEQ
ncbi:unnamed protein product [Vicia faba]|uniref:Uncharacterized protein n=1 Tax=Vicia faba TaxID=3906 RepID=A0AAV1ACP5_VICFA|nr:unnamed protein product [Vicia faba]